MGDDGLHEQQTRNSLSKAGSMVKPSIPRPRGSSFWRATLAPAFFYAVTTTGVFCRPSCASRRPLRDNVRFFRSAAEAQAAGFGPASAAACTTARTAALWTRFAHILRANLDRPVRLEELGRVAGLSPFTVQRLFKREMGVSPLAYQRALQGAARCARRSSRETT